MRANPPRGVIQQTESSRVAYGLTVVEGEAYSGRRIRGASGAMPDPYYPIPDPLDAGEGVSSVHPELNETVATRRALYDQDLYQDFFVTRPERPWTMFGPLPIRPGRWLAFTRRREFMAHSQRFAGQHGSPHLSRRIRASEGVQLPARRDRLAIRGLPRSYSSVTKTVQEERPRRRG